MIESMTDNPRPTRAENIDVGNSVFEQNDCTMLSGETANGNYPLESFITMSQILKHTENNFCY